MFTHKGNERTLRHNLGIASLLSFVAGIVNVAGFLAVQRLTTNVTGHFAFFVDEVITLSLPGAAVYFLFIFFFFLGSFVSNVLVELMSRYNHRLIYIVPVVIESVILVFAALFGNRLVSYYPDLLACALLFAMGLQNSLVTSISSSAVRTTHLTGLFTDLGIELSQLFFYKKEDQKQKLRSSIKLRFTIISFFFLGGLSGGLLYGRIGTFVLGIAAALLVGGIIYDGLHIRLRLGNRK